MSKENGKSLVSTRTVHEIYCAFILVATIILLAAVQWYQIDRLVELISFALTISSLVLALVAIGYSIYSGTGIERSVGNLLVAVSSVRSSASDIEGLRDSLTKEVRAVAEAVGGVASTVTAQSGVLAKMTEQQAFKQPSSEVSISDQFKPGPTPTLHEIVEAGSITGNLALLAVARCKELGRPIDFGRGKTALFFADPPYMHGYLVALSAATIISLTVDNQQITKVAGEFNVSASEIKAKLIEQIERRIKGSSKKDFLEGLLAYDEGLQAPVPPVESGETTTNPA